MKRTSAFMFLAAALLLPTRPVGGEEIKRLEEAVTFKARVQAQDPFDPRNEAGANGEWKVRRGEVVRVEVTGMLKQGWNTYPITIRTSSQTAGQLTEWSIPAGKGVTPLWPIYESEPLKYTDKKLKETSFKVLGTFSWSQDVLIDKDVPAGKVTIPVTLKRIQVCDTSCYPFKNYEIPVTFEVSSEPAEPMTVEVSARLKAEQPQVSIVKVDEAKSVDAKPGLANLQEKPGAGHASSIIPEGLVRDSHEEYARKMKLLAAQIKANDKQDPAGTDSDLLGFILAGMFWGAISLVTPCVFPMIPITVSFFLKQSEKEHHRPIVMASVYSLTIIIVLTLAAAFLLSVFQELSVRPLMNYFLGGLFVFFALSLFGWYDIELPHSLAQFTSSREGQGGIVGTIFMALTFTIISFACVAPFLGGFGGTAAAARPFFHNILGGLAFATTFAAPFFILAIFPALLRKLPKSGSWLNSVKVVMAFLELAAAFKFFRKGELVHSGGAPSFFTFDLVLGLWIAMSILCAIYLIGMFRLPHDTPEEHISVPRLLFSISFLGLALYLTPALFKLNAGQSQRPGGTVYSWVDAFLLPDSHAGDSDLPHTGNLDYAVAQARAEFKTTGIPKRVFIDFTGVTCDNCKINEKSVFTKPEIAKLFAPYIFVKMYTDSVPSAYYAADVRTELARDQSRSIKDAEDVNLEFRSEAFDKRQLPLYVILEPQVDGTIRTLRVYPEARINNEAEFADFLRFPEGK